MYGVKSAIMWCVARAALISLYLDLGAVNRQGIAWQGSRRAGRKALPCLGYLWQGIIPLYRAMLITLHRIGAKVSATTGQ